MADKATIRRAKRTRRSFRSSLFMPRPFDDVSIARCPRSLDREESLLPDQRLAFVRKDEIDELLRQTRWFAPAEE